MRYGAVYSQHADVYAHQRVVGALHLAEQLGNPDGIGASVFEAKPAHQVERTMAESVEAEATQRHGLDVFGCMHQRLTTTLKNRLASHVVG